MGYALKIIEPVVERKEKNILMILTGGTIVMLHKDNNPSKPLAPASWEDIKRNLPKLTEFTFGVQSAKMDLIDSSNMNPKYWIGIAQNIQSEYYNYDGFVILHGTDTMSYTATALSFLFENLGKPVIVTGSQLPLSEAHNDAVRNLVTALKIAASYEVPTIPEVCILFNNVLLRGNRSRKISTKKFYGFNSLNYSPLAKIGKDTKVYTKFLLKTPKEKFSINKSLEQNVMIVDIFPGISPDFLRSIFNINGLKGVILRTYGTGNAPTTKKFLAEIKYAIKKKKLVIVNITQCIQGMVEMGLYETSIELSRIGVISGADMTPEAAIIKMMFLLGKGYDINKVKEQMQENLRGELNIK